MARTHLDPKRICQLRDLAYGHARRLRLSDEAAEDAAQQIVLGYLEGKGHHQKLKHAVIDQIDFYHRAIRWAETVEWSEDLVTEHVEDELKDRVEDFAHLIERGPARWAYLMTAKGFTKREIGQQVGRSEAWASLELADAVHQVRVALADDLSLLRESTF